jgi:hypothetical protein
MNGEISLQWTNAPYRVYVEFTDNLSSNHWHTVAGPLTVDHCTLTPDPTAPVGFYRLRME